MTLHFLGSVNENSVDELIIRLDKVKNPAFDLVINQTGRFPRAKVIWLGADEVPAALISLVKKTHQCVSGVIESYQQKSFAPHVTLFRKARYQGEMMAIEAIKWSVDKFVLVESKTYQEGVEYKVIKEWLLS